ncbi:hypothetical protein GGX14DRAFT_701119 [Mycena pura]|uniref:F-box domain-containing protein n=1 Tax=Mycena pura TaxID=153505 RepID=A0AAD6Y499_9AGAR|nr:hypothetical protein GGX14DRAFT_701119 [Mycena pura]
MSEPVDRINPKCSRFNSMDIPLLSSPDSCGPPPLTWRDLLPVPGYVAPKTLVTLKSLLADRALTAKRPRQQPPSLIFRLPAEMLAEIFVEATAGDQEALSTFFPMHFHLVLSHVCGLWRAVALHTPSLWCRVTLHLGGRTSGFGGIKSLAQACFKRSCELPLALVVTSSVATASILPNFCMDLVLPVRHRIRHLDLSLAAIFTESIFKLPKNSLKVLRTLSISALISDDQGPWFRAMSGLEGAPLLESVKLRCVQAATGRLAERHQGMRFDPYLARLPWDRLLELHLEDLEIRDDDAIYALGETTSLVHCSLDLRIMLPLAPVIPFTNMPAPVDLPPPKRKPVTLPALRIFELVVSGHDGPHVTEFFDRLVLPSLKELSIKYKDRQTLPCGTLTALQTRSSFSLERLLVGNRLGDSILPFLESNPLLRCLQLLMCSLELAPLAAALTLASGHASAGLLPRLCTLTLADRWLDGPAAVWAGATTALLKMVRSRRHGGVPQLDEFVFGAQRPLSAKKAARLEHWRAEGLRVRTVTILPERRIAHLMRTDYIQMILFEG